MRIGDIAVESVVQGKNWKFVFPDDGAWTEQPMETWDGVVADERLAPEDHVIYSQLAVLDTGEVVPMLCLKQAGSPEYGGDYCWYVNGRWRQLGLEMPEVEIVESYTASPLSLDPSFDSEQDGHRKENREGFRRHASRMSREVSVEFRPYP